MPADPIPTVRDWRIADGKIAGTLTGHPRLSGAITVHYPIGREGEVFVTHLGDRYTLGDPAADYAAANPNARARVLLSVIDVRRTGVVHV
jgi:hypothetical protein